jgi:hypothetical protein
MSFTIFQALEETTQEFHKLEKQKCLYTSTGRTNTRTHQLKVVNLKMQMLPPTILLIIVRLDMEIVWL